jgi:thymidylate synthase/dihydrofolate reductase
MTIQLISCVYFQNNKFAIGNNENDLLFRFKKDLEFFKEITKNEDGNVILMGRKTWESLGSKPLSGRINIILTNKTQKSNKKNVFFMNIDQFTSYYNKNQNNKPNVFIIGGSHIYNLFLNHQTLFPQKIYLTHVELDKKNPNQNPNASVFFDCLSDNYKLISVSQKYFENDYKFRFLQYQYTNKKSEEYKYNELLKSIIKNGSVKPDRTGVGTLSTFGQQLHFDISSCVPLLTSKRVAWKSCIEELLWFLRGDTNASILQNKKVKIWDGNSSRAFLDSRGLYDYPNGVLGPVYGWQWRFFGADYHPDFSNTNNIKRNSIGGFDQIEFVVNELKSNPHSRRILVSAWNPSDLHKMALPPCHYSFQFYVREVNKQKYLDCHFIMRSTDTTLGLPFNLFSYTVLSYIIALKVNMKPGRLIYTGSDVHIYKNHNFQVISQLQRNFRPLPKLILNPQIRDKQFYEITIDDFDIVGYFPHPSIKMDMAV